MEQHDFKLINCCLLLMPLQEHNDQKYGGYQNTKNALKNIMAELGFQTYSD
jgi:hypothetical protein